MAVNTSNAKTLDNLKLRTSPELNGAAIRTLLKGEEVTIIGGTADCDGYQWTRITSWKNERGWVASKYLAVNNQPPVPVPPPTPPKPTTLKSIGIHVAASGDYGDLLGVIERSAHNDTPVPAVMVISDPGLCKMIKDRSPSTDVYYRWVTSDHDAGPFDSPDPRTWTSGRLWFDYMWARHSQATGADYHQLYNECSFGGNTQDAAYAVAVNTFEMQMMERATQVGVKVTIGNYMPGVPEALHIERLRPAFDMAEQQGHVLCYHAYSSVRHDSDFTTDSKYFALRWVDWVKNFPKLKVILGEAGRYNSPRFQGRGDMLRMIGELDSLLQPLRVAGRDVRACWWTIKGQTDKNWFADDWTPELPAYENWLKG